MANLKINCGVFATTPGQGFRFGSLDFVADSVGNLRPYDSAEHRSAKIPSSAPALGYTPVWGPYHYINPDVSLHDREHQFVAFIDNLYSILKDDSNDEGSTGSHHPSREVFIANATLLMVPRSTATPSMMQDKTWRLLSTRLISTR
jgi:hypothetical protein